MLLSNLHSRGLQAYSCSGNAETLPDLHGFDLEVTETVGHELWGIRMILILRVGLCGQIETPLGVNRKSYNSALGRELNGTHCGSPTKVVVLISRTRRTPPTVRYFRVPKFRFPVYDSRSRANDYCNCLPPDVSGA